jgi:manganese-dependent ADP-ribose/CDP-alcohol diphosphatase
MTAWRAGCTRRELMAFLAGGAASAGLPGCVLGSGEGRRGPVRFGVIADVQYADRDRKGTRYYRESPRKLAACVDALNREDLAFVIHLGDFIDRGFESFDRLLPLFHRLRAPGRFVLGNHDFDVEAKKIKDVSARLGMEERYYDFVIGGWRFVVLDGNDVSLHANPEGSAKQSQALALLEEMKARGDENAQPWNGALGAAQTAWLRGRLDKATARGERVVLFCHFPVFPVDRHNLWKDREIVALLEEYRCVAAWINGHNHAGSYALKNGIHYLTVEGMVETPDTTAWATVTAGSSRLSVNGRGREEDRILELVR